jgi:hypothetical protein
MYKKAKTIILPAQPRQMWETYWGVCVFDVVTVVSQPFPRLERVNESRIEKQKKSREVHSNASFHRPKKKETDSENNAKKLCWLQSTVPVLVITVYPDRNEDKEI